MVYILSSSFSQHVFKVSFGKNSHENQLLKLVRFLYQLQNDCHDSEGGLPGGTGGRASTRASVEQLQLYTMVAYNLMATPLKINMEHNHGGFPFKMGDL